MDRMDQEETDIHLLKRACVRLLQAPWTVEALMLEGEMCWAVEFIRREGADAVRNVRAAIAVATAQDLLQRNP